MAYRRRRSYRSRRPMSRGYRTSVRRGRYRSRRLGRSYRVSRGGIRL